LGVLALSLRIGAAEMILARKRALLPDSELYWAYAESILKDGAYVAGEGGARRTPGYPLFLAGVWKLAALPITGGFDLPRQRAALWAQSLLGAATAVLAGWLALRWEARGWLPANSSLFATALVALDPLQIPLSGLLLTESPFAFLLVLVVALAGGMEGKVGLGRGVLAGSVAGAAVLVRPSILLLFPFAWAGWRIWGPGGKGIAGALGGFLATLAPWWIRNFLVYGLFVPTTLNVGESLYDGWNPNAAGGSDMAFIDRFKAEKPVNPPGTAAEREIAEDRHWREAAVLWAKANPKRVLELAWIKVGRYWSPWPNAGEFRAPGVLAACGAFALAAYGGLTVGVFLLARKRAWIPLATLAGPLVYFCLLHAAFVSSVRYRAAAAPLAHVIAGAGLAALAVRLTRRRSSA
jgi:hypothetical protein